MERDLPDFDQWWDYDQPAKTERKFRSLLENEPAQLERLKSLGS